MNSEENTDGRVTIGISFGNSYSSIACTQGSDAKVIANEEGDRQIPSVLSYVEGEEFHGTQAKAQLVRNADNTVGGFRDYIGKNFESIDPTPSAASAKPFAHASSIAFSIHDKADASEPSTVTISDVTTRHFKRLASSASDYLGRRVTAAVIAVPTDFATPQKNSLIDSAKAADLEVLQLVPEPVVALLASDRKTNPAGSPADKISVVADLGGTRSDVAVISARGGMYTVLATAHDYGLGGRQCDDVLLDFFAKEFLKKHSKTGVSDPRENGRGLAKMRLEAEATKKSLSIGSTASFNVESLGDGIDYSATVNRTRYELLASKTFGRFTDLILEAVKKAELDVLDVDEVVLCGGTSHTPRIATNVQGAFPEGTRVVAPSLLPDAVNPSELTVRGAALQAELIEGFDAEDVDQSTHPAVTVTAHLSRTVGIVVSGASRARSGVEVNGEKEEGADVQENFKPVITAETPLPVRRTITFLNSSPSDSGVLVRLCEGERHITVTKPDSKPKPGKKETDGDDENGSDEDDDDDDASEEEEEETREKTWQIGTLLGELALPDVKKGARITAQITITQDLGVSLSASETGKTGVRGQLPGQEPLMNGKAH